MTEPSGESSATLTDLPPALGEWLQTTLAKGQGARVIALIQAIEDWMQVCHQQESEIERLEAVVKQGVKMFRTTYGSKGDFAYRANEWVADAERLLSEDSGRNARPES